MVTFEIKQRIAFICVEGDLFTANIEDLKNALQESWQHRIYKIAINLEKSNLINSSGIGIIIGALKTCRDSVSDGDLVVVNPSAYIRRTFRIMGIEQFLPTKDNVNEAIEYFSSPCPRQNL